MIDSSNAGQIMVRIGADTRKLTAGLASASSQVRGFGKQTTSVGQELRKVGSSLTRNLSLPLAAIGAVSVKMALDFEKSMTDISALTGASKAEIEGYKKSVLELAPAVGRGPKELADALYFIVSSGFKGAAALRVLDASARASMAGLGDVKTVADAVTSAVNAYGETALSAASATDIMLAAVREGKNEPEELAAAIGRVIAPAQAMGIEFSEVAAGMASMSLVGIDASESATALRGIMMSLLKPTDDAAGAFKQLGFKVSQIRAEVRDEGLLPTLLMLQDRMKKAGMSSDEMGVAFTNMFPNVRALNGILIEVGKNSAKNTEINEALANSTGDTAEASNRAAESMGVKLGQALAKLKVAAIELGDALLPVVSEVAGGVAAVAGAFSALPPSLQETAVYAGLAVAALGPMLLIGSKLVAVYAGISSLAPALGALSVAFRVGGIGAFASSLSGLLGPAGVVAVAAAIGTLVYALVRLKPAYDKAGGGAQGFSASVGTMSSDLGKFVGAVQGYIDTIHQQAFELGRLGYYLKHPAQMIEDNINLFSAHPFGTWQQEVATQGKKLRESYEVIRTQIANTMHKMATGMMPLGKGATAISGFLDQLREVRRQARDAGFTSLVEQIDKVFVSFRSLKSVKGVPAFDTTAALKSLRGLDQQISDTKGRVVELQDRLQVQRDIHAPKVDIAATKKSLAEANALLTRLEKRRLKILLSLDDQASTPAAELWKKLNGMFKPPTKHEVSILDNAFGPASALWKKLHKLFKPPIKQAISCHDKASGPAKQLWRKLTSLFDPTIKQTVKLDDQASSDASALWSKLKSMFSPITQTITTVTQKIHREAAGGDYLVTRPTLFLAGDAGAERATFTPIGGRAQPAMATAGVATQPAAGGDVYNISVAWSTFTGKPSRREVEGVVGEITQAQTRVAKRKGRGTR